MVHIVKADIASDPLHRPGKLVIRSAIHGHPPGVPLRFSCPVDSLKLVLYVEQPDAKRTGNHYYGHLDQKVSLKADGQARHHQNARNGQVGVEHAQSVYALVSLVGPAVAQEEVKDRPDAEHGPGSRRHRFPSGAGP